MAMCRACLASNALIDFDESLLRNYNLITNLNVNLYDGLPQSFCHSCSQAITFFIDFKEKCIESEIYLREAIEKTKVEETVIQPISEQTLIKFELKTEEDVFDNFANDTETYIEFISNNENDYLNMDEKQEGIQENTDESLPETKEKMRKLAKSLIKLKQKKAEIRYTRSKKYLGNKIYMRKPTDIPENKSLHCGICKKKFDEPDSLSFHLDSHKTDKQCGICDKVAQSWPQLFGHRLQHLPQGQKKCHLCKRRTVSPFYLEFHYLNFHNDGQDKTLKCPECGGAYMTPRKLRKHISACHSELRYVCDHCSKAFRAKSVLAKHMSCHSTVKTFKCESCEFACKSNFGLQTHKMHKHTPTKVTCQNCLRTFVNQEKCDKHKCQLKIVICPICGIQLGHNNKLTRHMDTHKAVGQYKCEICPSVYKTSGGLKTHMNRHKGIRDKKCEYCPAKFYYASVLTKHRRIHTGEKPYVCKICSRSFTGNHNLKVHMRIHGEFIINKKDKTADQSNCT
ncbi:unnamed protein product [Chilo suppressalis]|uniref:Uncharacterized protein n=1 Tax=Chilo suppressalis TaxID=168631 RepID=A0ABN8BGB5_CHISP|nr:hypothetical protein evm_009217 [Chilo suppressalis]CAH0407023.1 unnamed protein product [Chilo suppressalis]